MVAKTPKVESRPDAWVVINNQKDKSKPSDRGRKSIKNGKIYLDDGQKFEIELYSPLKDCILCDIKLNGQSISKNGLILKPGQRFYLDCFIDDKKKFIFNTYEIENSLESIEATSKNGTLEVFFYKESVIAIDNWKDKFDKIIIEKYYPVYYPIYPHYYDPWYYPGRITYTNIGTGGYGTTTLSSRTNESNIIGTTTNFSASDIVNCSTTSNNVDISNLTLNSIHSSNSIQINNVETGRVEKGSSSSQKFIEVDMDFESNYIASTILQLLPNSRKPIETKDILNKETEIKLSKDSNDVIELIKKLADLHLAGILTDDEFSEKKSELLSKI